MHISEGILPWSTIVIGYVLTFIGVIIGLKKITHENIGVVAIISSAFFIVSFIHVPIGISNAHLSLNGLIGIMLGWKAFPAIVVVLSIQALMFQYGGVTTLGVNTLILAIPSLFCYYTLKPIILKSNVYSIILSFVCGAVSVLMSVILLSVFMLTSYFELERIVGIVILAYIPMVFVEGVITASCISFLKKVKSEILLN